MSVYNSIFSFFAFCLFLSCSTQNEPVPKEQTPIRAYSNEGLDLIEESGIRILKTERASWKQFHQNYLKVTEEHEKHPALNTYTSSLIYHQVLKTSMLEEISAENYNILETYLLELERLTTPYTKLNYLLIYALSPYLEKSKLQDIAMVSINKALQMRQNVKSEIDEMSDLNDFEVELKKKTQEVYEEEYHIFLPKLQKFVAS